MSDTATRITAIVGEGYASYDAAHQALREANLSSYALRLLAEFSTDPEERHRARTAAACAFASMPAAAESLLVSKRKDSTLPGVVARATVSAHRGEWPAALELFEEAHSRRGEAEPVYSLAVSLHSARYLFYYGSYDQASHYLDSAAADATATLQWQHLIALTRVEIAARRGESAKADLYLNQRLDTPQHLRPLEALARATLSDARSDEMWRPETATLDDIVEALDRAQSAIAASILHFAISDARVIKYDVAPVFDRTLDMLTNDLAAQPFLWTAAAKCGPARSRIALNRLEALAAHGSSAARAFALLAQASAALNVDQRDDALRKAEEATRQFQMIGDKLYERKALDFIVNQRRREDTPDSRTRLTKRQTEIVALVRRGLTNKELAAHLHISEHTVERHLTAIFAKLNLRSRYQLS